MPGLCSPSGPFSKVVRGHQHIWRRSGDPNGAGNDTFSDVAVLAHRGFEQAKQIVAVKGAGELAGYAKMHFKTAYEAQGLEPPKKPAWSKFK
mgnify:CR=1 FL=1